MRRLIVWVILLATSALLHWWCSANLQIGAIAPSISVISVVAAAVLMDAFPAHAFGFFTGLYLDMLGANLMGGYALTCTLAVYVIFFFRKRMDFASMPSQMFLVLLTQLFVMLFYEVLDLIFLRHFALKNMWYVVFSPLFTAVITPAWFWIFDKAVLAGGGERDRFSHY